MPCPGGGVLSVGAGFMSMMGGAGATSNWGGLSKGEQDAMKDEATSKALAQAGKG